MIFNKRSIDFPLLPRLHAIRFAAVAVTLCLTGCDGDSETVPKRTVEPKVAATGPESRSQAPVEYTSTENGTNKLILVDRDCPAGSNSGTQAPGSPGVTRRKLWLGIQAERAPRVLLDQFELQCGLVVKEVVKGAPSDGFLNPSDLICQFNGRDLACEKRLCALIAEAGSRSCRLTVIRKTKRLEVEIIPQLIEILANGQIVQYTMLAEDDPDGMVDMPRAEDQVAERLRVFIVQPILLVDNASGANSPRNDQSTEQLILERVVRFGKNDQGERILIVQEADRTLNYSIHDIKSACSEVQRLWELVENQP
ncbi:MAG: hypothetical protein Q8M16_21200 [Pirellulaceae bacterium]|nr:hypothetical protein [Pirellulaceae bacterium]